MLFVNFAGYFQVRLPTDPDPTDEKRGVSGYTFALAEEPDFDRILRLHDPVAPRSHGPDVGVFVTSVAIGNNVIENHPLVGAKFDFVKEPKFWMLNYILTLDAGTEAIDPFIVEITSPESGIRIYREDYLDKKNKDLSIYDATLEQMVRRGGVVGLIDEGTMHEILQCETPKDFRKKRLALLQQDLDKAKASNDTIEVARLETRIGQILWPSENNVTWDDRRTKSLQFVERRNFAINGDAVIEDPNDRIGAQLDDKIDWPIQFWNGIWDCDALCGYMRGTLQIPVKLGSG